MDVSIIANGPVQRGQWLKRHITGTTIAVDGGADTCKKQRIVPDFVIGDFDSVTRKTLAAFKNTSTVLHVPDQSRTDLQKALALAHKLKAKRIFIFGALGGNFDHELANMLSLGDRCVMMDEKHVIRVTTKRAVLSRTHGHTVSVIALTNVYGLSYSGLVWKAPRRALPAGWIGVRNRLKTKRAVVTLRKGSVGIIQVKS